MISLFKNGMFKLYMIGIYFLLWKGDFMHFLFLSIPCLLIFVSYIIIFRFYGVTALISSSVNSFPLLLSFGSVLKWIRCLRLSFYGAGCLISIHALECGISSSSIFQKALCCCSPWILACLRTLVSCHSGSVWLSRTPLGPPFAPQNLVDVFMLSVGSCGWEESCDSCSLQDQDRTPPFDFQYLHSSVLMLLILPIFPGIQCVL